MRIELKDYLVEDKYGRDLAFELPMIAIFSSAPNIPGAAIKRAKHVYDFSRLKSRHVEKIRLPR